MKKLLTDNTGVQCSKDAPEKYIEALKRFTDNATVLKECMGLIVSCVLSRKILCPD